MVGRPSQKRQKVTRSCEIASPRDIQFRCRCEGLRLMVRRRRLSAIEREKPGGELVRKAALPKNPLQETADDDEEVGGFCSGHPDG